MDEAATEAKEQGHQLSSDEVLTIKKVEEQKVWDHTIAHVIIKHANKWQYGELQASLTNIYTLGNSKYLGTVEKAMAILSSYEMARLMHRNAVLTQVNRGEKVLMPTLMLSLVLMELYM